MEIFKCYLKQNTMGNIYARVITIMADNTGHYGIEYFTE